MTDGEAFIYLKAQIPKKLLLPLGGGVNFLGRYIHKLPKAFEKGANFLSPTSCSTNGAAHIALMASVMFGGFGRQLLSILATTMHMYTSDGGKGPYGHVFPKGTGAAMGVKQQFLINAIFTALRTAPGFVDGEVNVVGGSGFDSLKHFPNGVLENVLKRYIKRIGAEFPEIIKVFDKMDKDEDERYTWEKTNSGQQTGTIVYLDQIKQVSKKIIRNPDIYDNEMSYSFKMGQLMRSLFNAIKRQQHARERAKILAEGPPSGPENGEGKGSAKVDEATLVDKGIEITPQIIEDNAGIVISELVNALTIISKKNEKVVLALDTELGKGEINRLLQDLIEFLPELSKNNEDLARLLRNLIVIKGEGAKLSERLQGDLKSVKKENFIIIAKNATVSKYFNSLKGISIIAGIDDSKLSENDYIPLLEIIYFSVGKYFGWNADKLRKIYSMIPNVKTLDSMGNEYRMLFDENSRQFLFRIIPDAAKFDTEELTRLMKQLRTILIRA